MNYVTTFDPRGNCHFCHKEFQPKEIAYGVFGCTMHTRCLEINYMLENCPQCNRRITSVNGRPHPRQQLKDIELGSIPEEHDDDVQPEPKDIALNAAAVTITLIALGLLVAKHL